MLVKGDPKNIASPGIESRQTTESRREDSRTENLRSSIPQDRFYPVHLYFPKIKINKFIKF